MKQHALKKRAEWLSYCLSIGFTKDQLPELEQLWDRFKDEKGNLKKTVTFPPGEQKETQEERARKIEALAKQMDHPSYNLYPAWSEDEYALVSNIWKILKVNAGTNGKKMVVDEIRNYIKTRKP